MIQEKYLNPYTDFGFKRLFGEEANKDLLISFLNEILKGECAPIVNITYLKNEQLPSLENDRRAIFDLYCEDQSGDKFIVEMQKARQDYFKDRSLYYATFPIQKQAAHGEWNFELKRVYMVAILDFIFSEDKDETSKYIYRVKLSDIETSKVFYDKLTFVYLEMPKFTKTEDELETMTDKWLYVLRNISRLTDRPAKLQERVFEKFFRLAEISKFTKDEFFNYEESLKVYRDMKNCLDSSYAKGEKNKALDIARRMKAKGFDCANIADMTGLSEQEIKEL